MHDAIHIGNLCCLDMGKQKTIGGVGLSGSVLDYPNTVSIETRSLLIAKESLTTIQNGVFCE
jgi:hypothetical protein